MSKAILKTVSQVIGQPYKDDIKEAWTSFVDFFLGTMQEGAEYDALNRGKGMHL